jgi:sulfide:quinone oxidoreductase
MKKLVVLGHGTGGTIIATKMRQRLPESQWEITVIDKDWQHHYQPGWLFIPFGIYTKEDCIKPKTKFVPPGVTLVLDEILGIDADKKVVKTKRETFPYDFLVIATGCRIVPEEVEGLIDGWGQDIHNFYTLEGALALREKLKYFDKGRVVVNIAELPFKCPVAPLEFAFMSDWFFGVNGVRDKIEIELVTPLSAAFTKPVAAEILGNICKEKNIKVTPNFQLAQVDSEKKVIKSYGDVEVPYDLLVSIPPNFGAQCIIDSGMGDPMGYMDTDHFTLKAKNYDSIYVIGDAANVPTSKAGAVAHYEADVVADNLMREIDGQPPRPDYDGHAT